MNRSIRTPRPSRFLRSAFVVSARRAAAALVFVPAFVLAAAPDAPSVRAAPREAQAAPATATATATAGTAPHAQRADVAAFVADMVVRHGFIESELWQVFSRVHFDESVIRRITPPPPEFRKSWQAYRARFLDPRRIRDGVRFWQENEPWLALAQARYGVPPQIVVAIIGIETMYGRIPGDVRIVDALATLAFDYPPRADYFRAQLEQFLLYVRDQRLDAFSVRGSYAGAIGLPQFMPGSIRRFAVDHDGDGRIDLRSSPADAIGSVANFLAQHGWRSGEPIRFRTSFESESRLVPLVEAGIRPQFTIAQLSSYGISSTEPIAQDMPLALIDLPNGDAPTSYFLGAPNFYVITRYNRSSFYAMAVRDLARALVDAR